MVLLLQSRPAEAHLANVIVIEALIAEAFTTRLEKGDPIVLNLQEDDPSVPGLLKDDPIIHISQEGDPVVSGP